MQKTQEIAEVRQEAGEKIAEAEREAGIERRKATEAEREAGEARKRVVRNFKTAGVEITIIMQATGLSREEVDDI